MVHIEPYDFQKTTAFKERFELATKLNEIIEKFNNGDTIPDSFRARVEQIERDIADINVSIADIDTEISELSDSVDTSIETVNQRIDDEVASIDDALSLKADITQLSDGSVTKIGTETLGTTTQPIYLVDGIPTKVPKSFAVRSEDNTFSAENTFSKKIEANAGLKIGLYYRQSLDNPLENDVTPYNGWYEIFTYKTTGYSNGMLVCIHNSKDYRIIFMGSDYNFQSHALIKSVAGNLDVVYYSNSNNTEFTFYARVYDWKNDIGEPSNKAYICRPCSFCLNGFASTSGVSNALTQSSKRTYFNNVVYNNIDIPNIINYDNYNWVKL